MREATGALEKANKETRWGLSTHRWNREVLRRHGLSRLGVRRVAYGHSDETPAVSRTRARQGGRRPKRGKIMRSLLDTISTSATAGYMRTGHAR